MDTVDVLLNVIESAGVVGVLLILVIGFYRGDLISRQIMDTIIERIMVQYKDMCQGMAETIIDEIKKNKRIF